MIKTVECRAYAVVYAVIFLFLPSGIDAEESPCFHFWDDRLSHALSQRAEFFDPVLPDTAGIDITSWDIPLRQKVLAKATETESSVWSCFATGILYHLNGDPAANRFFLRALDLTRDDPGGTWLLFVEFDRYDIPDWTEKALTRIERQLFTAGAVSSGILSRQLLHYGFLNKMRHEEDRALLYFKWAHRLNPHETTALSQTFFMTFPSRLSEAFRTVADILTVLKNSWTAQLDFAKRSYDWFRHTVLFFMVITMLFFCIKYLPKAVHGLSHLYPGNVSVGLRASCASAVVISFVSFGILPFFWLLTFLIWRFLSKPEKIMLGIIVAFMVLTPVDAFLTDRFNHAVDPHGPIMRLSESISEGTSPNLGSTPSDSCSLPECLGTAVRDLKSESPVRALPRINRLLRSYPTDPFILNLKGISHYLSGSTDSAAIWFKKAINSDRNDLAANYNLAQCHLSGNDPSKGMDLLKGASNLNPQYINRFIQDNDRHFSAQWPRLRQVIFPDFTPDRFWSRIFLAGRRDPDSVRAVWGLSFFGFTPRVSSLVFLVLSGILIFLHVRSAGDPKIRRLFECKYCGKTICRRCTTGLLCSSCYRSTRFLKDRTRLEHARERIVRRNSLQRSLRNACLSLAVPFADTFLEKQRLLLAAASFAATSAVYSYWHVAVNARTPDWMTLRERGILIFLPLLFHSFCIIRYLPVCIKTLGSLRSVLFTGKEKTDGT